MLTISSDTSDVASPVASLVALLALFCQHDYIAAWTPDVDPDLQSKHDIITSRFYEKSDYFKILSHDDATVLVGARDVMYNISLAGLREIGRLEWNSSDADQELCALKGKLEADCHNYVRVYARIAADTIKVCGTNSYKPRCRRYALRPTHQYELIDDVEAQGLCPYSPLHNSTYLYTDGQLYSATVADFSAGDPLIYRENLRTEQYDLKHLNKPDFVGAIERNGYVMFFFREVSMENMNCDKTIYSRVARVCKNDRGGPYTLSKSWTSFLKARLNCSMPGEYPFYFDEIQAVTDIIERNNTAMVYAVFTTSVNAIPGSAVCAFNVDDILKTFDGPIKQQKDGSSSNWPTMANGGDHHGGDEVHLGQCVEDSRMLTTAAANFVKNHPLMEAAVPAIYGRPLLTKVNLHHRLTSITVDSQVAALNGERYDVIYAGTDDGKVTQFINIAPMRDDGRDGGADRANNVTNIDELRTVIISERQVFPVGVAVRDAFTVAKSNTLVVASDGMLVRVPLHHCANIYDCAACVSLQDPNCAWDLQNRECKSLSKTKFGTKGFLQNLHASKEAAAAICPKVGGTATSQRANSVAKQLQPTIVHGVGGVAGTVTIVEQGGGAGGGGGGNQAAGAAAIDVHVAGLDLDGGGASSDGDDDHEIHLFGMKGRTDLDDGTSQEDPLLGNGLDGERKLQLAGKSYYWGFAIVVLAVVFIFGMFVGLYTSRRICKTTALHANHRNQLSPPRPFAANQHRNSGKDVNLLVNANAFTPCNQKKANVDIVDEKDRSHECKNSTENLEKEIPCKTSTLTKVKRTYI